MPLYPITGHWSLPAPGHSSGQDGALIPAVAKLWSLLHHVPGTDAVTKPAPSPAALAQFTHPHICSCQREELDEATSRRKP